MIPFGCDGGSQPTVYFDGSAVTVTEDGGLPGPRICTFTEARVSPAVFVATHVKVSDRVLLTY